MLFPPGPLLNDASSTDPQPGADGVYVVHIVLVGSDPRAAEQKKGRGGIFGTGEELFKPINSPSQKTPPLLHDHSSHKVLLSWRTTYY